MPRRPKALSTATVAAPSSPDSQRKFWLFKSEPDSFSWDKQKARGNAGEPWGGVRNYLARNHMRAMKVGDRGFFYHSNTGKEIVGIVEVCAPAHPDPDDASGTWECVDVRAVADLPKPVGLREVKGNPKLAKMSLVTSPRLSVQPVTPAEWEEICRMGGLPSNKAARKLRNAQRTPERKSG
jgi:predicted RNA-binding protein with PUA-like domain